MFPKYQEIQLPLLFELARRGGESRPSEKDASGLTIYEVLADYFGLSPGARAVKIYEDHGSARSKWQNMVRWTRNDLRKMGYLSGEERGVWAITSKGFEYLGEIEEELLVRPDFKSAHKIDPETFLRKQKEAKLIGDLGEQYVLAFERKSLEEQGKPDLANKIKHVSIENVAAGYDILSFNSDGSNKYIEVKTTKSSLTDFVITRTELEVARKHNVHYHLYRVTNIKSNLPQISDFADPAFLIDEGQLLLQPIAYRVSLGETIDQNLTPKKL